MLPYILGGVGLLAGGLVLQGRKFLQGYYFVNSVKPFGDKLTNKVCVVTGANTGIGFEAAKAMTASGARVFLACRTEKKARAAADKIRVDTGREVAGIILLDAADHRSVVSACRAFQEPRIDVLCLNHGVVPRTLQRTAEGHELMWGVNFLSQVLILNEWQDKLKGSGADDPARVVWTASGVHTKAQIRWSDPDWTAKGEWAYATGYSQSKLAQIMYCRSAATREQEKTSPVLHFSYTPGACVTPLVFNLFPSGWVASIASGIISALFLRTPQQGAQTLLHCATAPVGPAEPEGVVSGGYYSNCLPREIQGANDIGKDMDQCDRLYNLAHQQLKDEK